MSMLLCSFFFCLLFTSAPLAASRALNDVDVAVKILDEQEADRVEGLPGQPAVGFEHYAGYVTVNAAHGRAFFYWFFEAAQNHTHKPLVLWLNGGPGCSSIGYGAMEELGPFITQKNVSELKLNKESWNNEANILFVESPFNVGFSYTNTSTDVAHLLSDEATAIDNYNFLANWFKKFPQYKSHDFYIAGESYAGHYIPQLAEKIFDANKHISKEDYINFKGFMVGNGLMDDQTDQKGLAEYAWVNGIIPDWVYSDVLDYCNNFDNESDSHSVVCSLGMSEIYDCYNPINIYNIHSPVCTNNNSSTAANRRPPSKPGSNRSFFFKYRGPSNRPRAGVDPCDDSYTVAYLNRPDVQKALHANVTNIPYSWDLCNNDYPNWQVAPASVLPIIRKLVGGGIRIWVYSGVEDGRIPVSSTRYTMEKLNLTITQDWQPWYSNSQVGGSNIVYKGGLTHVTVRDAGHMVPMDSPTVARKLFAHFLANKQLPANPPN
ncbi:serine carboxypeptidase-like 34 [Ananas comosus]|uniref:Carboxypeptidase n=1 Tax=Ananas comosus TaxID=4615 RepID=A0A6P5E9Z7_ANACO|nr:serine carboxypeptidase-like 34 [Ananas comosus]